MQQSGTHRVHYVVNISQKNMSSAESAKTQFCVMKTTRQRIPSQWARSSKATVKQHCTEWKASLSEIPDNSVQLVVCPSTMIVKSVCQQHHQWWDRHWSKWMLSQSHAANVGLSVTSGRPCPPPNDAEAHCTNACVKTVNLRAAKHQPPYSKHHTALPTTRCMWMRPTRGGQYSTYCPNREKKAELTSMLDIEMSSTVQKQSPI